MFENSFLETFTRIHYSVFFIFVPVIFYFGYQSIAFYHLSFLSIIGYVLFGLFVWTLTEYVLHRFVFHWQPPGKMGEDTFYFSRCTPWLSKWQQTIGDGSNCEYTTCYVILFPLPVSIGCSSHRSFFIGFISGYLFYDMTHYAIHHYNFKSKFWLNLKHHHMLHHYKRHAQWLWCKFKDLGLYFPHYFSWKALIIFALFASLQVKNILAKAQRTQRKSDLVLNKSLIEWMRGSGDAQKSKFRL